MSYNIRIGIGMDQQTNLKRIAEVINKIQPDFDPRPLGIENAAWWVERAQGRKRRA